MKRQRTIGQYRAIDLVLFAFMTVIFEFVATKVGSMMPYTPYLVSVTPALTAVVMMRWGWWAGIHAALGGVVRCFASVPTLTADWYLILGAGNLLGLGAMAMLQLAGRERIRSKALLTMAFGLLVHLLMVAGRGIVMLALGSTIRWAVDMAAKEAITLVFTLVLMWIVRRVDGLFEDQRHYLRRVQREEEEGGF